MIERKIKELSIALEALSRINHPATSDLFGAIEQLLENAITEAHKENNPLHTYTPPQTPTPDDDIPF